MFTHWYELIRRDATLGLSGTQSWTTVDGAALLSHRLTSGTFACALRVTGDGPLEPERQQSRAAGYTLLSPEKCWFSAPSW